MSFQAPHPNYLPFRQLQMPPTDPTVNMSIEWLNHNLALSCGPTAAWQSTKPTQRSRSGAQSCGCGDAHEALLETDRLDWQVAVFTVSSSPVEVVCAGAEKCTAKLSPNPHSLAVGERRCGWDPFPTLCRLFTLSACRWFHCWRRL